MTTTEIRPDMKVQRSDDDKIYTVQMVDRFGMAFVTDAEHMVHAMHTDRLRQVR